MKLKYFEDSDTLYIEFRDQEISESKDLDENTVLDQDAEGNICAITFEHASARTDVQQVTLEGIAA
jgi:uncharacterized protein YuzE